MERQSPAGSYARAATGGAAWTGPAGVVNSTKVNIGETASILLL